jgi:hypothetical protein
LKDDAMIVRGREFSSDLIARLEKVGSALSRRGLSRELCQWLDWKGPSGKWQTTNARLAIKHLEGCGALRLNAPAVFGRPSKQRAVAVPTLEQLPTISGTLEQIGPVELILIGGPRSRDGRQCRQLLEQFHPLGSKLCGAQLRYLIRSPEGVLGVLCFSAAARRLKARDQWIGWEDQARAENLHLVVNNSRFLIRPGVEVKNLASHVLAMAARQLPNHWQQRYGYKPLLLETFVEREKYRACCYRAANWIELVEPTAGRGRNDSAHAEAKSAKRILLYRLAKDARSRLCCLPVQPRLARPPKRVSPKVAPVDWAEVEFGQAQLGDKRLGKRLCMLARDFYARPQQNMPQRCDGQIAKTKAAYRFFDHPQVNMDAVLQPHYQATARRMSQHPVVLVAQDTTSLDYHTHPATENLGPISKQAKVVGLVVHDSMAFNVEGTPLGLVDVQCWARDPEQFGKRHQRKKLPFEEKESVKWLRSLEATERLQSVCPQTQIVSIGDREADIYELFVWATEKATRPQLLVRATKDRRGQEEHYNLWEQMSDQPLAGMREVGLPRREEQPARIAQLEVRFGPVKLRSPKHRYGLAKVELWSVWAREVNPPAGVEPVEWKLLTTLAVETLEQANEKLDWYTRRWGIEVFHRTLKSGCKIETRQLRHADRIEACLAIDAVVAWRIFHLCKLGREVPNEPCTVYFQQIEWRALVGFIAKDPIPPAQPPTLREAMRLVARLGGFLGRKSDGEPGTQTLWLGLQRLDDISETWKVFTEIFNPTVSSNRTCG